MRWRSRPVSLQEKENLLWTEMCLGLMPLSYSSLRRCPVRSSVLSLAVYFHGNSRDLGSQLASCGGCSPAPKEFCLWLWGGQGLIMSVLGSAEHRASDDSNSGVQNHSAFARAQDRTGSSSPSCAGPEQVSCVTNCAAASPLKRQHLWTLVWISYSPLYIFFPTHYFF